MQLYEKETPAQVFCCEFCNNKKSWKNSIVDVQLGSKYGSAFRRYWKKKLIIEKKNQKVINFNLEKWGKKPLLHSEPYFKPSETFAMEVFQENS